MSLARLVIPSAIRVVHQLDDGALLRLFGAGAVLVRLILELGDLGIVAEAREELGDHVVGPIELVDALPDPGRRIEQQPHLAPGGEGQHFFRVPCRRDSRWRSRGTNR
jgi:hypothetical protein